MHPCAASTLKSGDLVFIATPSWLYRQVARATGSKASHVGIVFEDPRRGWLVAESAVPVCRYRPLARFVARSDGGWWAVRRLPRALSAAEVAALRAACDTRMGRWYHLGFRYDSPRTFCSKFVHEVYREALGIEIGAVETFGELLRRNPDESLRFWKLWFFGRVPWSRRTITPASQLDSPALCTVFEAERPAAPPGPHPWASFAQFGHSDKDASPSGRGRAESAGEGRRIDEVRTSSTLRSLTPTPLPEGEGYQRPRRKAPPRGERTFSQHASST